MDASNRRDVSKRDLYVGNGHRWLVKEGFDDEPGEEKSLKLAKDVTI
jgi:hypothetical protein